MSRTPEHEPLEPIAAIREQLARAHGTELAATIARHAGDPRPAVRALIGASVRRLERERAEAARVATLYTFERSLRRSGARLIVGLDEVGRGALAGPLTAAACALPDEPIVEGLDDSKRLSPAKRRELAERIRSIALCSAVVHVGPDVIDRVGINAALRRAMRSALDRLSAAPDRVLLDGHPLGVRTDEVAIVGGDGSVASIAAASILAKVARDELMVRLSERYPGYDLARNKGYGTPEHLRAIAALGLTEIHRRSFCSRISGPRLF